MGLVHLTPGSKRFAATVALALAALLAALSLSAATASKASAATCPSFRVLHDDRIGPANLSAGNYTVTTTPAGGLSCAAASQLFTRFLQDYDGVLPTPWRVIAQGTGKASFARGNTTAFSVARSGGEEEGGNNPSLGRLCPGSFTVNAFSMVGPLDFPKGQYLIYLPSGTGIQCHRAAVLFTRFLAQPAGRLPFPWQLKNQTATFFKPEHPVRSSFRIEPASGS
ncbi:MAG: hypothetical protein JJE35_10735 [Thermoleophilia bacterium]|nr:hypothetical protein [Thermoleophilia bacterium]